jgi:hypothetical protein
MIVKYILFVSLFLSVSFAEIYYAKAEPLHTNKIQSNVSGRVSFVDEGVEGTIAKDSIIIKVDDAFDLKDEKHLKNQIKLLKTRVSQYKEVAKRRYNHFASVDKIASKSRTEKDSTFYAHVTAAQTLASARIELSAMEDKLFAVSKQIRDKNIRFKNWYVYDLHVTEGDYVTLGTPLLTVADISKVKLRVFLSAEDALHIEEKELYIDGVKSDLTFKQVWKISDSEHVSSYEALLELPTKVQLSQLVKVELK